MATESPFTGPLTLGQVLDRAFRLYRARPGMLLLTSAAAWVPMGLAWGILVGPIAGRPFGISQSGGSATSADEAARSLVLLGLSVMLMPLLAALYVLVTQALASQILGLLSGQEIGTGAAFRAALARFGSYFGSLFLQGMAVAGLTVPVYCCGVMMLFAGLAGTATSGAGDGAQGPDALAIAGLLVGFVFLGIVVLLPYEYLLARWMTAMPGVADQHWGAIESLQRSWDLTRGRVWRTLGFQLLVQVLGLFFLMLLVLPLTMLIGLAVPGPIGDVLQSAVGFLPEVLWQPLLVAAVVCYYLDLRVRRENLDLDRRIRQLESQTALIPSPDLAPQALPAVPRTGGIPSTPSLSYGALTPEWPAAPNSPFSPAPLPPGTPATAAHEKPSPPAPVAPSAAPPEDKPADDAGALSEQ